jgi:hypothetical protein
MNIVPSDQKEILIRPLRRKLFWPGFIMLCVGLGCLYKAYAGNLPLLSTLNWVGGTVSLVGMILLGMGMPKVKRPKSAEAYIIR